MKCFLKKTYGETIIRKCFFVFCLFFFNCYFSVWRPTLDRYRGVSLTHPMLINAFYIFRPEGHQEPRNEVGSQPTRLLSPWIVFEKFFRPLSPWKVLPEFLALLLLSQIKFVLFKVNNRNIRKRCEICSKLTIKTPEIRQWRRSGVFSC